MPTGQRKPPRRSVPGMARLGSQVARVLFISYVNVDLFESAKKDIDLKLIPFFHSELVKSFI